MASRNKFFKLDELLKPIPGDNPAGENLRYEGTYDQIEKARSADDTLNRGQWERELKSADWQKVVEIAMEALAQKSKDLNIAIWLTEALASDAGVSGLREGAGLIRELLAKFWVSLYPEIDDGDLDYRIRPLEWCDQKFPVLIRQTFLTDTPGGRNYDFLELEKAKSIEALKKSPKKEDKDAIASLTDDEKKLAESIEQAINISGRDYYESLLEEFSACEEEILALEEVVDDKFGKEAPGLTATKKALNDCSEYLEKILKQKPKPAPQPKPVEPSASLPAATPPAQPRPVPPPVDDPAMGGAPAQASGAPVAAQGAGQAPPPGTAPAAQANLPASNVAGAPAADQRPALPALPRDRADALERLLSAAEFLRGSEPHSPVPYLILRAVRWGEAREKKSSSENPRLVAPSSELRRKLKQLYDEKKWPELLQEAEKSMAGPEGGGWLDLQRYILEAMEKLGAKYAPAASALRLELNGYLADFQALPELEMSDGTPAANPETRQWLEKEIFSANHLPAPPPAGVGKETEIAEAQEADNFDRALAKLKSGQFSEGLALLRQGISAARCERERFLAKLNLADFCVEANKPELARPLLQELTAMIDKHRLEDWESPELNLRLWKAVYRCYRNSGNQNDQEQINRAFDKLCQLDVEQALALGGK